METGGLSNGLRGLGGEKPHPVEDGEGEEQLGGGLAARYRQSHRRAPLQHAAGGEGSGRGSGRERGLVPRWHRAELWAPVSLRAKLRSLCF